MQKLYILIGIFLLMNCVTTNGQNNTVKVVLKNRDHGKGYFATCRIILKNTSKKAKWFLILPPNTKLTSSKIQSNLHGSELFTVTKYTKKKIRQLY